MSGWSYGWPLKWLPMQTEEERALIGGISTHLPAHWWPIFRALGSEGWLCWLWHWTCLVWYFKQEQNQPLQKVPCQSAKRLGREETFPNQSQQDWHLLALSCLIGCHQGLKKPYCICTEWRAATSRFVRVGWWLPCCSPSLEVDSATWGLPG